MERDSLTAAEVSANLLFDDQNPVSSFTQNSIPRNPNPAQYIVLSDSDSESTTSHDSIGKANLCIRWTFFSQSNSANVFMN